MGLLDNKQQFFIAGYIGNVAGAKKLIDEGIDIDLNYKEPDEGKTALMVAATKKDEDMLLLLLEGGANPDIQDNNGNTALMYALNEFQSDRVFNILAMFLDAGVNLELNNTKGKTCLDVALNHTNVNLMSTIMYTDNRDNLLARYRSERNKEKKEAKEKLAVEQKIEATIAKRHQKQKDFRSFAKNRLNR